MFSSRPLIDLVLLDRHGLEDADLFILALFFERLDRLRLDLGRFYWLRAGFLPFRFQLLILSLYDHSFRISERAEGHL